MIRVERSVIQKCDFIGSGEKKSHFYANLTGILHETNANSLNEKLNNYWSYALLDGFILVLNCSFSFLV